MSNDDSAGDRAGIDPLATRRILLVMLALVVGGVFAFRMLREPPSPPPAAIAGDALLVQGREVFLARCVSCHGTSGRGDGPIARGLSGPPVGDLTDATWKHGDRPDQVLSVVSRGVRDTSMPGWAGTLNERDLRSVSAYVYFLARRPVPRELREP